MIYHTPDSNPEPPDRRRQRAILKATIVWIGGAFLAIWLIRLITHFSH